MNDPIDRQAAIDAVCKAGCGSGFCGVECDEVFALRNTPSAQLDTPTNTPTDCISRQAAIDSLDCINGVEEVLRSLPAAQPDLSDFCDRLWKAAYERGKAEAQADIIHCGECKHRDPEDHKCDCGHDILWQLPRDDKWYCADAERRTDEAD